MGRGRRLNPTGLGKGARRACIVSNDSETWYKARSPSGGWWGWSTQPGGTFAICRIIGNLMFNAGCWALRIRLIMR